jgi:hypothetical protein
MTRAPTTDRATHAQLKRAAGSQSLDTLKDALIGYTVDEIDSIEGKNPLHLAAWQGCLENVSHLLELGCNINAISTGEFSYGKTPIFFALTRSRDNVVSFLLEHGANVKIVNNKGQSVLSIAASHLTKETIGEIQLREEKEGGEWINYRASHSDCLEYGDLDPRFIDRPLRPQDVVTNICINPTTKQSRQGAFLRKNPHRAAKARTAQPSQPPKMSRHNLGLSDDEQRLLDRAWLSLESGKLDENHLLTVVSLSLKRRDAWIVDASDRLRSVYDGDDLEALFRATKATSGDEAMILQRLYAHIREPKLAICHGNRTPKRSPSHRPLTPSLSIGLWHEALLSVQTLSMSTLEIGASSILALPHQPTWVDSITSLQLLASRLDAERVVAFDSEWFTAADGTTRVSTLQLAVQDSAWVVDLVLEDTSYQQALQKLVDHWFNSKIMLGFALKRDLHKLSEWSGSKVSDTNCLDLQLLWNNQKSPPGLAACVYECSGKPLSKLEQCSDWSRRPLSESQLAYAGLDAAILPYLLAAKHRRISLY